MWTSQSGTLGGPPTQLKSHLVRQGFIYDLSDLSQSHPIVRHHRIRELEIWIHGRDRYAHRVGPCRRQAPELIHISRQG